MQQPAVKVEQHKPCISNLSSIKAIDVLLNVLCLDYLLCLRDPHVKILRIKI